MRSILIIYSCQNLELSPHTFFILTMDPMRVVGVYIIRAFCFWDDCGEKYPFISYKPRAAPLLWAHASSILCPLLLNYLINSYLSWSSVDTLTSQEVMNPKNIVQTWICIFPLLLAYLGNNIYQLHKILICMSFIRVTGLYLSSLCSPTQIHFH